MAIFLPSTGPESWKALLADPEKHWKTGFSAKAIAYCWEASAGVPPEIDLLLGGGTELLMAIPEHKVPLPGGRRASQCDVFALIRQADQVIAAAVEGKANEPFGPTIGDWLKAPTDGRVARLTFIAELLGRTLPVPHELHYQLFHRTAAAIIEARRFNAPRAAMLVHSFSSAGLWFEAYAAFAEWLGLEATPGKAVSLRLADDRQLSLGWAQGDARILAA